MKEALKKVLAMGVAASMTLAMSVSVFADFAAEYDAENQTVSVTDGLSDLGDQQLTILIVPKAADDSGIITDDDILYINQDANGTPYLFTNMGLRTALEEGVDYVVKVGGENIGADDILVFHLNWSEEAGYILGDVDENGAINGADASDVLSHYVGVITLVGNALLAADVDKNSVVNGADASDILSHYVGVALING